MKKNLVKPASKKINYKAKVVTFSVGRGSKQPECKHNNCYNC